MDQSKEAIGNRSKRVQSRLASDILRRRYLRKDKHGRVVETPKQMFRRVARAVAAAEKNYGASEAEIEALTKRLCELMIQGMFLPNSPTLMNAGRENGMLSACFVLPVPDNLPGIFKSVQDTAMIQKAGGGTGFSFDSLRPTGDLVASSGGTTSGPMSFLKVFCETTRAIQQGSFRRGANMAMMSIEHPDIVKFLQAKNKPGDYENFNFSVKISDCFMEALADRPSEPHVVVNPRTGECFLIPHGIAPATYTIDDLLPAGYAGMPCLTIRDVWVMIVKAAHATGEPGVCFIDRVNEGNPTPALSKITATNPCGEQPLLDYESCNLGSINCAKRVRPDGKDMDWDLLGETTTLTVRFLDNVIDVNHYPIPEIREKTLGNRKIGLGIMGFADALVLLGIRYDSDEAVAFAEKLARFVEEKAHEASEDLAKTRGVFPNHAGSQWDALWGRPMRNATCTTIAPTGSISLIAGASSGIEPIYSLAVCRKALDGQEYLEIHPLLEELGRRDGWLNARARSALKEGLPPEKIPGLPKSLAKVLVTAHQVAPEWHVRIQAAFQKHIDNAVSKTVNLPASATIEDVDKVFRMAFELGCKGITVYRDGSRKNQTLSGPASGGSAGMAGISPRSRGRVTKGKTLKFRMGCGTLFVTVNQDEQGLCEVFANLGKAGGCPSQSEATCRVVSAALRSGVAPKVLVEQLRGIRCLSTVLARKTNGDISVLSCPDAIAQAIEEAVGETPDHVEAVNQPPSCDLCGSPTKPEGRCWVCLSCGYSKCG
jgi:ribonucleoside-diphosphate reductase alpha chain